MITKNCSGKVVPNSRSSKKHGTLELTGIPTRNGGCSIGGSSESPGGPPFSGDEMLVSGRGYQPWLYPGWNDEVIEQKGRNFPPKNQLTPRYGEEIWWSLSRLSWRKWPWKIVVHDPCFFWFYGMFDQQIGESRINTFQIDMESSTINDVGLNRRYSDDIPTKTWPLN